MTERAEMEAALEAILFMASEPLGREKLVEVFEPGEREAALAALEALLARYRGRPEGGLLAEQVAGGIRLVTRPDLAPYLRRAVEVAGRPKLSMAALETLAIVAYRQPVTAPEIQELRGVNSKSALSTLLEHRLIRLAGRRPVVGQPFLYRTTNEFLAQFGLDRLEDLPPLAEFEEALGIELGEGPATLLAVAATPDVARQEPGAPVAAGDGVATESSR
ncbi:MAG: SMC-Scp complex subunit ScpB [Thermoanaerobaculia bacterium]